VSNFAQSDLTQRVQRARAVPCETCHCEQLSARGQLLLQTTRVAGAVTDPQAQNVGQCLEAERASKQAYKKQASVSRNS
jgi:hypothetical protein